MGFFSKIKSGLVKALDTNAAFFSNPIMTLKSPKKGIAKWKSQTKTQRVTRTLATTATVAAATLVPATAVGRAGAVRVATTAASGAGKIFFGSVPRVATTVFAAGVIAKSATVRKAIVKAPATVFKQGSNVGALIDKTPAERKKEFSEKTFGKKVKSYGVKAGVIAAVAGVAVVAAPTVIAKAKGLIPFGAFSEKEIKVNGQVLQQAAPQQAIVATTPVLPETVAVSPTTTPTKPRRATKKPSMKQSVRVNVVNNSGNRRYIRQEVYA